MKASRVNRRRFTQSVGAASLALPRMKITRIRAHAPPNANPLFNQSDTVVTVESSR